MRAPSVVLVSVLAVLAAGCHDDGRARAGSDHAELAPPTDERPSASNAAAAVRAGAPAAVAEVVERLGRRLAAVSLLAPPDAVRRDLREQYGPLVTPSLLDSWLARPHEAPGREVSSPWPDRIEIASVERLAGDDAYEVAGDVVLVTSAERAEGGAAARRPVVLVVARQPDGGWRIRDWKAAAPR